MSLTAKVGIRRFVFHGWIDRVPVGAHPSNPTPHFPLPRYKKGKKFDVPDKCVLYSMPCPNSPGQATQLYDEFCKAQNTPVVSLQETLQVTPELLEMAWEETVADEEADEVEAQPGNAKDHLLLTPDSFIELVHAHVATSMEKYMAWKLLQTETAHIFFREIKDHGRVVAFKAKTRKAVVAAKEVFCRSHQDNELCYV